MADFGCLLLGLCMVLRLHAMVSRFVLVMLVMTVPM
jgi:hypothetical protein